MLNKYLLYAGDLFLGTKIISSLHEIEEMNKWSGDRIASWQNNELKKLVHHAYQHTKYYKELFDLYRIHPNDINCFEDLEILPPLTKKIIADKREDLIAGNLKSIPYKRSATGGSTAEPLIFLRDLKSWSFSSANSLHNWNRIGYKLGNKHVALGSSNIIRNNSLSVKHILFYFLKGKISLPAIEMSDEILDDYLSLIMKKNVSYIYGYSTAIYLLALRAKKTGLKPNIKGCISTSELLLPEYRDTINDAFGCMILDAYGAGDGGISAFNHTGNYFEVGYNSYIQISNSSMNTEAGSFLVTDLMNYSMPFLRYEVGDAGKVINSYSSKHSYNGQLINELYGRVPNIMRFINNKTLIAPAMTVLFSDQNVQAYRFLQLNDKTLEIHIIKGVGYTEKNEKTIVDSISSRLGSLINIIIIYKENFDLQNSGKRNYFLTKQKTR